MTPIKEETVEHSLLFIDSWLQFRYEQEEIPGFVVALAYKGELVFNRAYGYANLERGEQLTPAHIFRVASHSKTFTATAILQLVEKERLRLDDYVVQYLPWLIQHHDERWRKVTLRQLLSHSAGVIRDGLHNDFWNVVYPFPDTDELQQLVLAAELVLDSNHRMKYSNIGYSLLGEVIEAVSGQPYNEYVVRNIIEPLDLQNTGPEFSPKITPKLVTGYSRKERPRKRKPIANIDTRAMSAATGFYADAADLCRYFSAQRVGSGKLLSDESKREMQRVQWQIKHAKESEFYGLGFSIKQVGEHTLVGHGGGFPGHTTHSCLVAENELVLVVLTNCIDGNVGAIRDGIVSIIDYYTEATKSAASQNDYSLFEGRYISLWSAVNIVATGDKIVATRLDWKPFEDATELEYIDRSTLKVTKTSGYGSEGELIHFNFNNTGEVESVLYCGATLLPEAEWHKRQAEVETVGIIEP